MTHLAWICFLLWAIVGLAQDISDCLGYVATDVRQTSGEIRAELTLQGSPCNVYGNDLKNLSLLVEYQTKTRLHVKIYDTDERAYQIPKNVLAVPESANSSPDSDLSFALQENPFSFSVTRNSTGEVLFNTTGQALIFESQYLRLQTSLPDNPNIYGLGENSDPFRHDPNDYSHTIWNSGEADLPQNANLYGAYPIYYDHRGRNGTHAVYMHNSNGMKVNLGMNNTYYLEYNILGGVLDLYFLSGPTPKDVSAQFADVVGHAAMMPYWAFGFHQCRYGYQDTFETAAVVANYSTAQIPLETIWNDINYMDYRATFSLDPLRFPLDRMQQLVDVLHDRDQHYIVIVDPGVASQDYPPFQDGIAKDAFLKWDNGTLYTGAVWPGPTNFPDWFAPNAQAFWDQQFDTFFSPQNGVDIDGLWIDMDEASGFCTYPCTDPELYAIEHRDPPRPPPVRTYSPYNIPGFPGNFQPHCIATVTFYVDATAPSQDNLLMLGNSISTGNNAPYYAPLMSGTNGNFNLTIQLPANYTFIYSYPLYTYEGMYIFEAANRTFHTGSCGSIASVSDHWVVPNTTASTSKRDLSSHPERGGRATEKLSVVASAVVSDSMQGLPGRNLLTPPYNIDPNEVTLSSNGLPTNLHHANGLAEYDVHNFFGSMMGRRSHSSLLKRRPGKRPLIITRSTYVGDSARVGHWFGDNQSNDEDYRLQMLSMIQFVAMFQVPMVGSDVCGFLLDTNPILCARWAALGAWNPFYRNHADTSTISQEFYRWPLVADAARTAIATRYKLLDYMYTNLHRQNQTGIPMLTPLMWEYPYDANTYDIELQFFHGDAFMICPVTVSNSTSVIFYMPADVFYDFDTFEKVEGTGTNVTRTNVTYSQIPVYIRGGNIVPMRVNSANTTTALRKENFELVIAPGGDGRASGSLYLDDGESVEPAETSLIQFEYQGGLLTVNGTFGYDSGVHITSITLLDGSDSACPGYNATAGTLTRDVGLSLMQASSFSVQAC